MKLAIFKVNQLGDNVVFLPVVQALRQLYPRWDLLLLTSPVAAELFRADLTPEQMLVVPTAEFNRAWKRPVTLLRLAGRLWREQCDASLMPYDQGNVAHLLARYAGGAVRVGSKAGFIKVPGGLTEVVELPPEMPMAPSNWEMARVLVERLGGKEWPATPPPPNLGHLFGDAVPHPGRIVIHCGASLEYKRWFPERYLALANQLAEKFEVLWVEQPHVSSGALAPSVLRANPKSLSEFVTTLRTASLLIANNSGPMNIASALGCPAVIISGPSHPIWDPFWFAERFLILRDETLPCLPCDSPKMAAEVCRNVANPLACMARWSADEVFERATTWMERWSGTGAAARPRR